MKYIYGFEHGNFVYFVTTQRLSVQSDAVETRIARFCKDDDSFFSYMEVPVRCHRGVDSYNVATAAYLSEVGPILKRRLNLDEYLDVLYVTFSMTIRDQGYTPDRTKGSVICSFPMSQVMSSFTNETKDCYNGEPQTRILQHIAGTKADCIKRVSVTNRIIRNTSYKAEKRHFPPSNSPLLASKADHFQADHNCVSSSCIIYNRVCVYNSLNACIVLCPMFSVLSSIFQRRSE